MFLFLIINIHDMYLGEATNQNGCLVDNTTTLYCGGRGWRLRHRKTFTSLCLQKKCSPPMSSMRLIELWLVLKHTEPPQQEHTPGIHATCTPSTNIKNTKHRPAYRFSPSVFM